MASTLELTLVFLVAAVAGVVVCRLARLPPMLGYLAVGVALGPSAIGLGSDAAGVGYLAEFGIVFLMFVIGLEFNLPKLLSMRKLVFGLGLSQVVLTIAAAVAGNAALVSLFTATGRHWGLGWQSAIALGAALAMSSTAIVVKLMADRLELESEHGRRVMAVLLFQDLAVVPLLVIIPALSSTPEVLLRELAVAALKAAALLALLLVGGRVVMRWWLTLVVRRKSEELFVLNLLLVTLGLAFLTELAGLSLALGAFVAGMLIAETEFKHQVETDIRPFHDVLLGLFFIIVGMKLNLGVVLAHWPLVLVLTLLPVLFKFGLVTVLARVFGAAPGVALRTGLYLAQAGEFGFVLLGLASQRQLLPPDLQGPVLASMVLSMLATPLIFMYSNRIVMRLSANDWLLQSVAMTTIARRTINTESHVIICGFGRSGQNLARLLEAEKIAYIALDLDPDRVRQAAAAGQSVVFGDAARLQSLMAAGLARASAVVVSYHDTPSALKILHLVALARADGAGRRSHDRRHRLRAAARRRRDRGRARSDRGLADARQPRARARRRADAARAARRPATARRALRPAARLLPRRRRRHRRGARPCAAAQRHAACGERQHQPHARRLALRARTASRVVSLRRASGAVLQPGDSLVLAAGDTLVLSGPCRSASRCAEAGAARTAGRRAPGAGVLAARADPR